MDIGGIHIPTLIGTGAGASAAFTAVYGTFSHFEKIQSRQNRLFVSQWLLGLQVPKEGSEKFFVELFNKLFGFRHWSVRCGVTSFILSSFLITFTFFGSYFGFWSSSEWGDVHPIYGFQNVRGAEGLIYWIIGACLIDYLSLGKTRFMLTRLSALQSLIASIGLVVADFIITSVLFCLLPFFVMVILVSRNYGFIDAVTFSFSPDHVGNTIIQQWIVTVASFQSSYYWVALLTSAWLWAYVLAAQTVRMLAYVPRFIQCLSKVADVQEHPVRVLGFVGGIISATIVVFLNVLGIL